MEFSVMDIAQILIKLVKGPSASVDDWVEFVEDRPFNDQRYYISNKKVRDLGWTIQVDLMTGLKELV
jgi:dTDP-D-glucose 4,6-dehydratase